VKTTLLSALIVAAFSEFAPAGLVEDSPRTWRIDTQIRTRFNIRGGGGGRFRHRPADDLTLELDCGDWTMTIPEWTDPKNEDCRREARSFRGEYGRKGKRSRRLRGRDGALPDWMEEVIARSQIEKLDGVAGPDGCEAPERPVIVFRAKVRGRIRENSDGTRIRGKIRVRFRGSTIGKGGRVRRLRGKMKIRVPGRPAR